MNNRRASDRICPHQFCCRPTLQLVLFYDVPPLTVVPQQVPLHGQWLGKRHHNCLSTWWPRGDPVRVIFFCLFFQFSIKCLLGISFLLDITVPTAFILKPHKWSKILGPGNHLSMYTQWPFLFILSQPINNTEHHVVFWVGRMCPGIYIQVVGVAAFCLTKFKHFYSIFMGLSFDINTKEYMPSKWAYCLVCGHLFFWCVEVLKYCDKCVNNWPNSE